jgi:hypothetical protein
VIAPLLADMVGLKPVCHLLLAGYIYIWLTKLVRDIFHIPWSQYVQVSIVRHHSGLLLGGVLTFSIRLKSHNRPNSS